LLLPVTVDTPPPKTTDSMFNSSKLIDLDVISGGSDADVFKLSYQDQAVKSGLANLIKDFELGVDTLDKNIGITTT
jgi:hypothetical protein